VPYRVTHKLLASDVNEHRRLRLSKLCEMVQEATIAHTELLGAGRKVTLDRGLLWVIMQLRIEIVRMPAYDELVELETWPGDMMHVLFPRYTVLRDEAGKTLIRVSALWMLMDESARRMAFPERCGVRVPGEAGPVEITLPAKLRDEDCERTDQVVVPYSQCDINGHLGNARFVDLADDRFGRVAAGELPRLIEVEYAREVMRGACLELGMHEKGERSFMRGTVDGAACFRLRYTFPPSV
jgi:medium-chain acyl-[acyl-carrier-protein] hydrolase